MQKLNFKELVSFENEHHVWEHTFYGYPLWIHCREPLLNTGMMAPREVIVPSLTAMSISFFKTLYFLATQNRYDKVFFLMERTELLEIYKNDSSHKKILIMNYEKGAHEKKTPHISSDFFNLLRFTSRKIASKIFYKKYHSTMASFSQFTTVSHLDQYVKVAMGDALFLKLLSLLLSKKNKKFYSGSVIPMGEKFLNRLNSYEVQHGVIHKEHVGYIAIPEVKNTLILYSEHYKHLLTSLRYKGKLVVNNYKKSFFEKQTTRKFPIVIYTQPTTEMQEAIRDFFQKHQPKNVYLQKHPKDYYDYGIDSVYYVTATTPLEVTFPIMYLSSIIENFTLYHKTCYIFDLKYQGLNAQEFIQIYRASSHSKFIIKETLSELYYLILKQQQ